MESINGRRSMGCICTRGASSRNVSDVSVGAHAQHTSFFVLSYTNPLRRLCQKITKSKAFEYFILLVIFVNCLLMALNSQLPSDDMSEVNKKIEKSELILLVIFSSEMMLYVISKGFVLHPGSYLRDPWHALDFVVVISGVLSLPGLKFIQGGSVKALRAMRVLRPLKLVSGVPSLQIVMKSILMSIAPLSKVFLLVILVVVIYAVIGLQMLQGLFHKTCFNVLTKAMINETDYVCGSRQGRQCPDGYECRRYTDGPNRGITNFDNIYLSMLAIFQVITGSGWTDLMYWTNDVYDVNAIGFWVFYYSLNIVGARLMLNLVLGILSGEFGKEGDRRRWQKEFLKQWHNQTKLDTEMEEACTKNGKETKAVSDVESGGSANNGKRRRAQRIILLRLKLRKFTASTAFESSIMVCVLLNTLATASTYYGQPEVLEITQDIVGDTFIGILLIEMCLKLIALGIQGYFKSPLNTFDAVVVISGLIEMILYYSLHIEVRISLLRSLKLLKLFKFTRHWKSLKNLVRALLASIKAILSLVLLLGLFLIIFALLGMTLFGGKFQGLTTSQRANFDDFWNAFLAVFQILTTTNWNDIMYDGVTAYGGGKTLNGMLTAMYFVAVVLIGNYVLLNVFLAIAVDNLNAYNMMGEHPSLEVTVDRETNKERRISHSLTPKLAGALEVVNLNSTASEDTNSSQADDKPYAEEFALYGVPREGGTVKPGDNLLENLKHPGRMTGNFSGGPGTPMIQEDTLFVFKPKSKLRVYLHLVITWSVFDACILGCILANSLLLAVEDTVNESARINTILGYFDFFFTPLFALELFMKIVNYGLVLHAGSYLRSGWNIFDVIVVSGGVTSLLINNMHNIPGPAIKVLKFLRLIRVLRPLKSVDKSKKLKAVFNCMIYSLKNVSNLLLINVTLLFVFSAMGVQLFAGQFSYCTDESKLMKSSCVGRFITFQEMNYYAPIEVERKWITYDRTFDNIAEGMITLFAASTGEGWSDVMFKAIDGTGTDSGRLQDSRPRMGLFFLVFVVVVSFFLLNIFVALIILTFQEQCTTGDTWATLDRNQRQCLEFAMRAKPIALFVPEDFKSLQYTVYSFISSKSFDKLVVGLIILNTTALMLTYDGQSVLYGKWLYSANHFFNFLFTLELLLKVFACGFNYFKCAWNVLDCILVFVSWGDFAITTTVNVNDLPFDAGLFRLFRALRLIKLFNRSKKMKVLLFTFIQSFKALPYVGALIFLLFFIYSVLGMNLFSHISRMQDEEPWNKINRNNHFRSFFSSFQVLFRCTTGEGWPEIMLACGPDALCDTTIKDDTGHQLHETGSKCGSFFAYLYFITFIFFCSFLMLNLFVAVIMDNFSFLSQDRSILSPHHLDDFIQVWAEFDPRGRGYIKHNEICELLRMLSPPLGMGSNCPKFDIYKRLIRMNMFMREDGTVGFNATLFHLCRTSLGICMENNNMKSNEFAIRALLRKTWPNITKHTVDTVLPKRRGVFQMKTLATLYSAKLIYINYVRNRECREKLSLAIHSPLPAEHPVACTPNDGTLSETNENEK